MRSILKSAFQNDVMVNGRRYILRPTVAHMLMALDALRNPELLPIDRARLACWHLYKWPRPKCAKAAIDAAFRILNEPSPYRVTQKKQTLSLQQDAAMICAAFQQLYGIDLPNAANRMDWRYFNALLGGITQDTALGGIMDIRAMELPKRTANNGKMISDIMKQKREYALRDNHSQGNSFNDGLKGMVQVLMGMAKEVDGNGR